MISTCSGAPTLVGISGSGTSAEEVNLVNPAADTYTVFVHGFAVPGHGYGELHAVLVGARDRGRRQHDRDRAGGGDDWRDRGTIGLTFTGLAPGTKYLGSVVYGDGVNLLPVNPTIVRVDP